MPVNLDKLTELMAGAETAWLDHVAATERLNAAIPDIEATPAERALYAERYTAQNKAEREMRNVAMAFAAWCAEQSASADLLALQAEADRMRGALEACAQRFREYERLHMAKGSIDGDAKARSNCEMAEMCEAALEVGAGS